MRLNLFSKQKGLVLEAMFFVMLAGLMAIPSYAKYENRVKVREGLALASSAKVAIAEFYIMNDKQLPQGSSAQEIHKELGLAEPQMIRTNAVESISVGNDLSIRIQYQPKFFNDSLIVLKPTFGESISWTCQAQSEDKRFLASLPVECRD